MSRHFNPSMVTIRLFPNLTRRVSPDGNWHVFPFPRNRVSSWTVHAAAGAAPIATTYGGRQDLSVEHDVIGRGCALEFDSLRVGRGEWINHDEESRVGALLRSSRSLCTMNTLN